MGDDDIFYAVANSVYRSDVPTVAARLPDVTINQVQGLISKTLLFGVHAASLALTFHLYVIHFSLFGQPFQFRMSKFSAETIGRSVRDPVFSIESAEGRFQAYFDQPGAYLITCKCCQVLINCLLFLFVF